MLLLVHVAGFLAVATLLVVDQRRAGKPVGSWFVFAAFWPVIAFDLLCHLLISLFTRREP